MDFASGNRNLSFRTAAITASFIFIVHFIVLAFVKNRQILLLIDDLFLIGTSFLAAFFLLYAAWPFKGSSSRAWIILAIAVLFNALGETAWSIIEVVLQQNPFPSVADIGYLMFYPLFAAGILLLPDIPLTPREQFKILLDSAIVIVSAGLIFWVFFIAPIAASSEPIASKTILVVSTAYPLMDLILFIALVELLFRKLDSPKPVPAFLLALNMAVILIGDAIFSMQIQRKTFISGSWLDSIWLIGYLLIGLAGVWQANSATFNYTSIDKPRSLRYFGHSRYALVRYLPYLGIAAAFSLLIIGYDYSRYISYSTVAASVGLIIGLMFVRQKVAFDESNQLLKIMIAGFEDRDNAEDALRKSEIEKAAILGGLKSVAIEYLDPQMRIIWVNTSVQKYLGLQDDEIKGKKCFQILYGLKSPCPGCSAFKSLQTGQSEEEEELVTPDENTWISRSSPIKDEDDKIVGVVHVALNITERQKAESALKESERLLASIIDFLPDATFVINKKGEIVSWNRAIEQMTGIKAKDILGKGDYEYSLPFYGVRRPILIDMVHKPDQAYEGNYYNLKRQDDGSIVGESYMPKLRNGEAYLLGSASALYDSEGNYWGAIESIRDISERKHAEDDLQRAKENAESATRAKSEFLANMSHEIRTPMNAVIGMTDLLMDENLTDLQREYVDIIRSGGNALMATINDILDITKIEAEMMELEHLPFNLHNCIKESMELLAADAGKKGLKIRFLIEENTPIMVWGDSTRLGQILINLLNNAVKFTEKGEIVISVSNKKLQEHFYEIHFAVKDTGIGIPRDKMNRLFQSFSQIDASTTRRYGGSGLGLAISKKLVELMGGRIWVESKKDVGSTFHFTIQFESTLSEPIGLTQDTSLPNGYRENLEPDLRILLAEDNLVNQKVIQRLLNKLKYRADTVSSGIEVLQVLKHQNYDVILMDVLMPDMDGLEATRTIRQRCPNGPKIIAMTASALKGDREMCLAAGMDGYISKPVRIEELKSALEICGKQAKRAAS